MTGIIKVQKNKLIFIPILLFIVSFSFLSFNLSEQGPHRTEIDFDYAYSVVYFNLIKDGDFFHPCWNGSDNCELLSVEACDRYDHWVTTHGLMKHVFVGLGIALHGEDMSQSYIGKPPLCKPHNNPIPGVNIPEKSELSAARFFTPVLGSLTVVLAYFIGKILFNRFTGFCFSLLLLFNSLWFAYSRTITTETYVYFFTLLSFFLLLYSLKKKGKTRYSLLIISAIVFGIAFDTKAIAFMFLPLFIATIFLRNSYSEKINKKSFQTHHFFSRSIIICLIFSGVLLVSIVATLPFYWIGPFEQINFLKESLELHQEHEYNELHLPWEVDPSKLHIRFISTITVTFAPIIDTYYNNFSTEEIPKSVEFANNFSSIPLSILFLTGICYLIHSIKNRTTTGSEVLIIVWCISILVFLSTMTGSYSTSRFFVMMFFPIILIASYGYWKFFKMLLDKKLQIFSMTILIFSHAITTLIFWEELFYKPSTIWREPLLIKSQEAITHNEVLFPGVIFLGFFIAIGIYKLKTKV